MKQGAIRNLFSGLLNHVFSIYGNPALKRLLRKRRNFIGPFTFVNRSQGREQLVIIVAGFKPEFWPIVFPRLRAFIPRDYDVCIVCPGCEHEELDRIATESGWSLLATVQNRLALAQNLAIREHTAARFIHKFDEDIVIPEGYFAGIEACSEQIHADDRWYPGIIVPLLNVNGFTSRIFLDQCGKTKEFVNQFGSARQACMDTPFWTEAAAAQFLWECSRPFDKVADSVAQRPMTYSACPHRFSIGAFYIERVMWEKMQGFTVASSGELGAEEVDLCAFCTIESYPISVCENVLAGHLGFGGQTAQMVQLLANDSTFREELRTFTPEE